LLVYWISGDREKGQDVVTVRDGLFRFKLSEGGGDLRFKE
jgi:hypothetical protein